MGGLPTLTLFLSGTHTYTGEHMHTKQAKNHLTEEIRQICKPCAVIWIWNVSQSSHVKDSVSSLALLGAAQNFKKGLLVSLRSLEL